MDNNETINVKRENLLNTYKNANDEQKAFLKNLFGTETFKPKDIRKRIKTFHDAYCALGNEHPFVIAYENLVNENDDVTTFFKLSIIVTALNEGWTPQFTPGEYRWAPYFLLYTKEELDEMDEDTKESVSYRSVSGANGYCGVSFAYAFYDSANVFADIGSRLALKSKELAEYAGQQFLELYADFILMKD